MCSPRKSNEIFLIFTFYESKQMLLTQDLRWSLGRSIGLQLQRQTDLLLCTTNCFLQWDHLPNMAVGDLAFYYTLYLWITVRNLHKLCSLSACFKYCGITKMPVWCKSMQERQCKLETKSGDAIIHLHTRRHDSFFKFPWVL